MALQFLNGVPFERGDPSQLKAWREGIPFSVQYGAEGQYVWIGKGGIAVAGAATCVFDSIAETYTPTVSGGLTAAGSATIGRCIVYPHIVTGGLATAGAGTIARARARVYGATGGLLAGGRGRVSTLPMCTVTGSLYHPSTGAKLTSGQLEIRPTSFILTQGKFISPTPVTYSIPASGDLACSLAYSNGVPYLVEYNPDPADEDTPISLKSGYWRNRWTIPAQASVVITSL